MEILIIGGAFVALMVYVSTKIKKSAARAYERETVETEDFQLVKPEGFIIPVNENSEYAFEARSKEFGEDEADGFPKADVKLKIFSDLNFKGICQNARQSIDKIISEEFSDNNSPEKNICLIKGEKTADKISFFVFHKIVESGSQLKIYDLKISVLQENREQYKEKIAEILGNFVVK